MAIVGADLDPHLHVLARTESRPNAAGIPRLLPAQHWVVRGGDGFQEHSGADGREIPQPDGDPVPARGAQGDFHLAQLPLARSCPGSACPPLWRGGSSPDGSAGRGDQSWTGRAAGASSLPIAGAPIGFQFPPWTCSLQPPSESVAGHDAGEHDPVELAGAYSAVPEAANPPHPRWPPGYSRTSSGCGPRRRGRARSGSSWPLPALPRPATGR